jgi:UDP-glucose 4-epimerase
MVVLKKKWVVQINILLTGNSGYIGSHLSKLLKDHRVFGLDLNPSQIPIDVQYVDDIRNLNNNFPEFDTIIHLAALVNVGESELIPRNYYDTNLIGTLNILNKIKCKNFIFASTGAAEQCVSAYGVSKRAAEDCVREFCIKNHISYTIFRFYNVIGTDGINPTNQDGLMYNLINSQSTGKFTIYGTDYNTKDGTCVRDYVHVNEICHALMLAVEKPSMSIECLGHGVGHTVKEMAELFKLINNLNIDIVYGPRRPGDIESSVLANVSTYMKNLYSIEELLKI